MYLHSPAEGSLARLALDKRSSRDKSVQREGNALASMRRAAGCLAVDTFAYGATCIDVVVRAGLHIYTISPERGFPQFTQQLGGAFYRAHFFLPAVFYCQLDIVVAK